MILLSYDLRHDVQKVYLARRYHAQNAYIHNCMHSITICENTEKSAKMEDQILLTVLQKRSSLQFIITRKIVQDGCGDIGECVAGSKRNGVKGRVFLVDQ